ncbi:MAG: phosphoglucosamine mutase, partial [Clostridia bacterium]|nr:phosphoglucosamine mutase [Clostridia bacterium]
FRGEANVDLTAMHAFKLGRFLGHYYSSAARRARVVIGKDTRASGYMLEDALCAGLTSAGADAYLLHVTTTPSVSYVARTEGFDCGALISASHNPYWDNGITLLTGEGEKLDDAVIAKAEAFLDAADTLPYAQRDHIGRVIDYSAGRNRYIGYLISLATHSFKGVRVGLDCANGSTWQLGESVFKALGADVTVLGNTPNGENINRDCGSTHIENLQRLVVEKNLDVGVAFDGDADRCIAVDEKGTIVNGDRILYIYAVYMKKKGSLGDSHVVTTVLSNLGLYKALEAQGIGYEQTDVGDRFVYERMRQRGDLIGGEESGHIIFSKYATTGDGLLTAIKVMQAMLSQKRPLSELHEALVSFPQVKQNVRVDDKQKSIDDPDVQAAVDKARAELGDAGRVLLRKSGTEPVVRVMSEALTHEAAQKAVDQVVEMLKKTGHALTEA